MYNLYYDKYISILAQIFKSVTSYRCIVTLSQTDTKFIDKQGENVTDCHYSYCFWLSLQWFLVQALFPVKSKQFLGLTKRTPLAVTEDVVYNQTTYTCTPSGKCSQPQAVQTTLNIYNVINPSFQKQYVSSKGIR